MRTYGIYKAFKQRLSQVANTFYFMGQYLKKADQTSYVVPAIYIEMPRNISTTYFGRVKTARNVQFKIHVVSNAPHKGNDTNPVQDSALQAHENLYAAAIAALEHKSFKNGGDLFITGQIIEVGSSNNNYDGPHVYSVATLQCDMYER